MGVYIKGMEMPSCCMFCPLSNSCGCGLTNPPILMTSKEMLAGRPDWCPLVPVPPHGDLIDREAALAFQNELEPCLCRSASTNEVFSATKDTDLVAYLQNLPAADVRPVVRGKWIMNDECRTVCSLCGNVVAFVSHPDRRWDFGNFCPNCGADMREATP